MENGTKLTLNKEAEPADLTLYQQLIGSLIYLTNTQPDISFVVEICSGYMS